MLSGLVSSLYVEMGVPTYHNVVVLLWVCAVDALSQHSTCLLFPTNTASQAATNDVQRDMYGPSLLNPCLNSEIQGSTIMWAG